MKKFIDSKCKGTLLKMNIQLFANGGAGDGGGDNPDGGTPPEGEIKFASQSELDSWFDKKMEKSLSTARSNWDKETKEKLEAAERKGKMTAEELAKAEIEEQRTSLEKERQEVQREKDEAAIIKKLSADKLPDTLASALQPLFGQGEDILNSTYDAISKSFRESVESAVNLRLARSAETPAYGQPNSEIKAGDTGKRLAEQNTPSKTESSYF
ncbi:DUF4355 domain-containing protein [Enterococcus wangshanyuanii]|uniref:DUF4355 domain-containing protein n=1 Tax=Enterococcus wangshanyuanii TaxID=2005703 RepID=A0ABQ1P082_9ENTE|nr:DUF4355 domain-containing protein [Enterococcus wangshanyuanii]GGC87861.1 hypothetical protein GCM10011573_16880 [Enterococcus wangshanyuanii]